MRIADHDRERVAEVLHAAAGDGRLDLHEVDERLRVVYAARTYADLEPLVQDLPNPTASPVPGTDPSTRPDRRRATGWAVAALSTFTRRGHLIPARRFNCLVFCGDGTIDLREAHFAHDELTIHATAILGSVTIIVPEDAEIHVTGTGVMGDFNQAAHPAYGYTARHASWSPASHS